MDLAPGCGLVWSRRVVSTRARLLRRAVSYVMETCPIVKRKDVAAHGSYRTKELTLEIFDAVQEAMDSGVLVRVTRGCRRCGVSSASRRSGRRSGHAARVW